MSTTLGASELVNGEALATAGVVATQVNVTGAQAARKVLDSQGLYDVQIEQIPGELSDHYDPRHKVLRLSLPASDDHLKTPFLVSQLASALAPALGIAPQIRFDDDVPAAGEETTVRLNAATGFRVVSLFTEDHAALTGSRESPIAEYLPTAPHHRHVRDRLEQRRLLLHRAEAQQFSGLPGAAPLAGQHPRRGDPSSLEALGQHRGLGGLRPLRSAALDRFAQGEPQFHTIESEDDDVDAGRGRLDRVNQWLNPISRLNDELHARSSGPSERISTTRRATTGAAV